VLGQPRSTQRYQSQADTSLEQQLVARLHELVRKYPRFGYRMMTVACP